MCRYDSFKLEIVRSCGCELHLTPAKFDRYTEEWKFTSSRHLLRLWKKRDLLPDNLKVARTFNDFLQACLEAGRIRVDLNEACGEKSCFVVQEYQLERLPESLYS